MRAAIYVYEGMTALDAIGPFDLLNRLPDCTIQIVGDHAGPKKAQGGLTLLADHDLDEVDSPDLVLVPGGGPAISDQITNSRLQAWLRATSDKSEYLTSVCTGALLLGAAGILSGRRATTHWRARRALSRFGATYVEQRVVIDGNVVTSAGVTAGLDMAVQLAEMIAGRAVATAIQLSAHYDPQPPIPPVHFQDAPTEIIEIIDKRLGP